MDKGELLTCLNWPRELNSLKMIANKYRKLRRAIRSLFARDHWYNAEIDVLAERHGGSCAWWVAPRSINANSIVYSFGIGEEISFELSLVKEFGVEVFAYDPTPRSIAWVKEQGAPRGLHVYPVGLSNYDGVALFYPPHNEKNVSHSLLPDAHKKAAAIEVSVKSLRSLMLVNGHRHIDVLKMDIEGSEYDVIDYLVKEAIYPAQLLIEFHHRFPSVGVKRTRDAVEKLKSAGYQIFYVSENGEEFSLMLVD